MDIDFSLVLVVLVAVCGLITLLDFLYFAKKRASSKTESSTSDAPPPSEPAWIEYPKSFFPVLLIVLLLRSFLVEPFKIPSGSMLPTLRVGDYILVNKYTYGLRLPVIGTKIWTFGDPDRGDVMVFKYPENPRMNYIKRVIAIPGDTVSYIDKKVLLNGEPLNYEMLSQTYERTLFREQVGKIEHDIMINNQLGGIGQGKEWKIPEGHYFVLGDNRDNSRDSRSWGLVPDKYVVGRAFAIWMHMPGWVPSFSRNGGIE